MLILSNWVVNNLNNSLDTWNDKLTEIWTLITESPETFKGGAIWNVIKTIHGGMQAIGLALLVLFFVVGVMKTCGSLSEVKKPEHALRLFIRFAIAKIVVKRFIVLVFLWSHKFVDDQRNCSVSGDIAGRTETVLQGKDRKHKCCSVGVKTQNAGNQTNGSHHSPARNSGCANCEYSKKDHK